MSAIILPLPLSRTATRGSLSPTLTLQLSCNLPSAKCSNCVPDRSVRPHNQQAGEKPWMSILKSVLQKLVRRQRADDAVIVAAELWRMR